MAVCDQTCRVSGISLWSVDHARNLACKAHTRTPCPLQYWEYSHHRFCLIEATSFAIPLEKIPNATKVTLDPFKYTCIKAHLCNKRCTPSKHATDVRWRLSTSVAYLDGSVKLAGEEAKHWFGPVWMRRRSMVPTSRHKTESVLKSPILLMYRIYVLIHRFESTFFSKSWFRRLICLTVSQLTFLLHLQIQSR
jgi:hypothetical protein